MHTLIKISEAYENIPRNIDEKYNPVNIERIQNKLWDNYDSMNVQTKRHNGEKLCK